MLGRSFTWRKYNQRTLSMQHRLPLQQWHARAQQKNQDQRAQSYCWTRELEEGRHTGAHRVSNSVEAGSHLLGTSIKGSAALQRFGSRRHGSSIHPQLHNSTVSPFPFSIRLKDALEQRTRALTCIKTCRQQTCFSVLSPRGFIENILSWKLRRGSVSVSRDVKSANEYIA